MEDASKKDKQNMQKSLEGAARVYKAAKEMEQSAMKMKRLADDLFAQVEKTMEEFKILGKDFLESYNEAQSTTPPKAPPTPDVPSKEKEEGIFIKRKHTPAE